MLKTAGGSDIEEAEEELSMCCDAPIQRWPMVTLMADVPVVVKLWRVEEGMDSFVNPNDQDGTDNEKAVDPMADDDLADEDLMKIARWKS